jgi:hypothetical protein
MKAWQAPNVPDTRPVNGPIVFHLHEIRPNNDFIAAKNQIAPDPSNELCNCGDPGGEIGDLSPGI